MKSSFKFETISETLAKRTISTPRKPRKQRQGLNKVEVLRRCKLAYDLGFMVISGTEDILGQNGKIRKTTSNGRLSLTFRDTNNLQLTLLQKDYVEFYFNRPIEKKKPYYTAQQVKEYLILQEQKNLADVFVDDIPTKIKEPIEVKKVLDKYIIGKKTIPTALNKKTPVPDNWTNLRQDEQDEYLRYYVKSLLNNNKVQTRC